MLEIRNHLRAPRKVAGRMHSISLWRRARGILLVAAAAAVLGSGCGSSAKAPSATTTAAPRVTLPPVPVRDRFVGTLHNGTGSMAGARDAVEARLQAPGTTGTRRLTLWIVSTGCPANAACAHFSGSLHGQLTPVRALPDIGRRYAIEARGSLGRVGVITAAGTVGGTGNINSGFESLHLRLTGQHGSARLSAQSSRVPPFTSP
jgi:hypothetical protein